MNNDPKDHPDVISARSSGELILELQRLHATGNRQATIAAIDGYLSAISIWLNASVGPEATFNIMSRHLDAAATAAIEAENLQKQE